MSAELGVYLLLIAVVMTLYAIITSLMGYARGQDHLVTSARNALLISWPVLTLAVLLLISRLVAGDFNVEFVWSVTSLDMPQYLKVTALWGGQAGSLLFWTWLVSTFTTVSILSHWDDQRPLMAHIIAIFAGTLGFFLLLVTFWENPFARYWEFPTGDIQPALFGVSQSLSNWSEGLARIGEGLPSLFGIILRGFYRLSPPAGSTLLQPLDGQGLNPLLRHPGMVIHPPALYLGFVGFIVPYGFGMAALINRDTGTEWIQATRRWTLIAWLFLSFGLILGGWWAYDVLGWGGYWAWDPVENAAFMPWLTGTAFLHSVMIQEQRGMLRRWNIVLITLTYMLVILGTFATRSGFVSSVHSFAQSAIGPLFFLFLSAVLVLTIYQLINRWDDFRDDHKLDSLLSRETVFLLNNLLFVSIMVTVGLGTYWPVITELLAGIQGSGIEKSSLGPEFYIRSTGPMFLSLLLLMGIAPLVAWKHASFKRLGKSILWPFSAAVVLMVVLYVLGVRRANAMLGIGLALLTALITLFEYYRAARARVKVHHENWLFALWTLFGRNRRRYGGYLIHLGVVVMAIGIMASNIYQLETQQALAAGQTITVADYVLEYQTLERYVATDGRGVVQAQTVVYKNGREVSRLVPRIDNYPSGQPMSIPGKYTTPQGDDFYVLLVSWEPLSFSNATFKVYFNPLVNWVWGGGFILMLGTLVAAWPSLTPARVRQTADAGRRMIPAGAGD